MEIGSLLKQTRVTKGYSLEEIEEATKIRARYLEAIENEEFDLLPGQVYVIAFLRNYARYLGVNDDELVQQYKEQFAGAKAAAQELPADKDVAKDKRKKRNNGKPRYLKYLIAAAVVGLIFAIASIYKAYVSGSDLAKQPNVVHKNNQVEPVVPKINNEPPETNQPAQQEKVINGVELVLNVTKAKCWMRIDVDGEKAFEGTVNVGDTKEFNGKESIDIILGNAGVVEVKYNGENLGTLGPNGEVVKEQFKAKQG